MPEILKIINENKCYGCGGCANSCVHGAISMVVNSCGFLVPRIDTTKCVDCQICDQKCPSIEKNLKTIRNDDYKQKVYSVRLKDFEIRKKSSSGGLFTAISDYILEVKGCVAGVVWNSDFSVKHCIATDSLQRDRMRQSKYLQSNTENCFKDIKKKLRAGKKVLFTGTPCQNAALKLYLKGTDTNNLVLCDVLCGGNVSPKFFSAYLNYIETKKKDQVESVCFRTKKIGWKQHHICVQLKHSVYEGARKDKEPFFDLYLKKYTISPSCFSCGFASTERITDITIGDFWGIEKVDPKIDDDMGISFLSVNSLKGEQLLKKIEHSLWLEERNIDIAIPRQINLQHAPNKPIQYEKFWSDYKLKGGEYVLKHYTVFGTKNGLMNKIKKTIRKLKARGV